MVTQPSEMPQTLVDYLQRYQIATPQNLASRRLAGCYDEQAALALLEQCESRGWLKRAELLAGATESLYFHETQPSRPAISGLSPSGRSLEERLALWAIARFCASSEPVRELLTAEEFRERFGDLRRPGESPRYYLEPAPERTRLAYLKVDLGGTSQWDRIVDACNRFVKKRLTATSQDNSECQSLFRHLVDEGRFQVSLLVACPEKAAAIRTRLDLEEAETGVRSPIVPYVVPGLWQLLLRSPLKPSVGKKRRSRRQPTARARRQRESA